jgi:hypothetical protein
MPIEWSKNPRFADLEIAMRKGKCRNGNFRVLVGAAAIRCYHHNTCVLELDREDEVSITDHGTYGWSVSTSKAIGQYLAALVQKRLITRGSAKVAAWSIHKNQKGTYDEAASWYPVRAPKARVRKA